MTAPSTSAALLLTLESSLRSSQSALLTRDLGGLEQATRDQMRLRRELETLWAAYTTPPPEGHHGARSESRSDFEFAADARAAQLRVLHLGKVVAAILVREQRWLAMLANLVAGPGAGYGSTVNRRTWETRESLL